MFMTHSHAAIVLASGLSTRLGQAKQLLSKNGESLICHMLKLALATKPQAVIVIVPDKSAIISAIAPLLTDYPNGHIIVNKAPSSGMAHSLSLGIDALAKLNGHNRRILIMGIDQVLLDAPHLSKLLAATTAVVASRYVSLDDDFSTPDSPKEIIGLPIVIKTSQLQQWQSSLIGDKGLRYLIRDLPSEHISMVTDRRLSYDIDMPMQLAHAKRKRWLDS